MKMGDEVYIRGLVTSVRENKIHVIAGNKCLITTPEDVTLIEKSTAPKGSWVHLLDEDESKCSDRTNTKQISAELRKGHERRTEMIEINFRNGEVVHYKDDEYTDYKYDGKYFIVIRDNQWIGFYNLDCVMCIEVHEGK